MLKGKQVTKGKGNVLDLWSDPEILQRLKQEIDNFDKQIRAREIELNVLASKRNDVLAYLQGLARTDGDTHTVDFFDALTDLYDHDGELRDQIMILKGLLLNRLSV